MNCPSERYMKRWDYKNDPISPKKSGISSILLHIPLIQRKCCKCSKMFGKKGRSSCIPCAYYVTSSCRSFCLSRCSYLYPNQWTTCHFVYKVRFPIHRPKKQIRYASYTSIFSDKLPKWRKQWDIENKIELNYFPLAINPFIQQLS